MEKEREKRNAAPCEGEAPSAVIGPPLRKGGGAKRRGDRKVESPQSPAATASLASSRGAGRARDPRGGSLTKGLEAVRLGDLDRESWLALRRRGIGGSDAAAVAGESRFSSPFVVWAEKTGRLPPRPDTEAMRLGRDLEDYVARRFTELTGKRVRRLPLLLRNPKYPFALADVDRAVLGERAGLECKTSSTPDARPFRETDFPAQYRAQCLHYLAVTGWDRWYLAVLVFGKGFFVYTLERDEGEIAALMETERRFWTEQVVAGKPPVPDGAPATGAALAALWPRSEKKTAPLFGLESELEDYTRLRGEKKELEGRLAGIENRLKAALGAAETGEAGRFTVSWKPQTRRAFQPQALSAAHPEIDLAPYWKETETRVMRVSEMENEK